MTFNYDRAADALDIRILEGGLVARTEELDSGTLVDVDEQGHVVSIEVIRPARRWPLEEILERFHLSSEDSDVLLALWRENETLPFAEASDYGSAVPA